MTIRSEAVQKCCLPELTVKLTLDCHLGSKERRDLVEFLTGLLLGSDIRVRKWFAHFIKSGQKVCFYPCLIHIRAIYASKKKLWLK